MPKIISDFKDFYDGMAFTYGRMDLFYRRYTESYAHAQSEINRWSAYVEDLIGTKYLRFSLGLHRSSDRRYYVNTSLEMGLLIYGHNNPIPFLFCEAEDDQLLYFWDIAEIAVYRSEQQLSSDNMFSSRDQDIERFYALDSSKLSRLIDSVRAKSQAPIVCIYLSGSKSHYVENPNLKAIGVHHRIHDHCHFIQEIDLYLGRTSDQSIEITDDITKRNAHGFDGQSFKKPKA